MCFAPKLLNYLFCQCILSPQFSRLDLSRLRLMKAPPTVIEHLKGETHLVNFSLFFSVFFPSLPFLFRQQTLLGQGLLFFVCTIRASFLAAPCVLTGQKWFISSENAALLHPFFLCFSLQRFCYAEAKQNLRPLSFPVSLNYLFLRRKKYPKEVKQTLK